MPIVLIHGFLCACQDWFWDHAAAANESARSGAFRDPREHRAARAAISARLQILVFDSRTVPKIALLERCEGPSSANSA